MNFRGAHLEICCDHRDGRALALIGAEFQNYHYVLRLQWHAAYSIFAIRDSRIANIYDNRLMIKGLGPISPGKVMAEREGFEPSIRFPVYTLSKRAPSATRPSLRRIKDIRERESA